MGSGKGLHVDQVLWSNIGKHWHGYKLLATWPAGEISARMVNQLGDAHFRPPLGENQRKALEEASKIVLLRPGDVFLMSGGVAHTTLCIDQDLSVTAYESLVTLHPRHAEHFMLTGNTCGPGAVDRGVMENEELVSLRQLAVRRLVALLEFELQRISVVGMNDHGEETDICESGARKRCRNLRNSLRGQLVFVARLFAEDSRFAMHATGGARRLLSTADALALSLPDDGVPLPTRPLKRIRETCDPAAQATQTDKDDQGLGDGDTSSSSSSSSSASASHGFQDPPSDVIIGPLR